jgi:DNA-binding MarR family transcriptional regulator/N-acetylglutamate synthase-like GNAT family acetyltransferase
MATSVVPARDVATVRAYNRFYTRTIGLLDEHLSGSPWSLAEARVLYELAHRDAPAAADLVRDLGLDAGYLSRMLARFEAAGLVKRRRSPDDARRSHVLLTAAGHQTFAALDRGARADAERLLGTLPRDDRRRLTAAMQAIRDVLGDPPPAGVVLRDLEPGDAGWIVERHGALYASEFGYDATFEGLVAKIAGEFLETRDPRRERAWIAERAGARVGSVLLVRADDDTAKLRLLIVEPSARGYGVGGRLVDACTAFARDAGYRRITLWTQSHLAAARALYERAGYVRIAEAPHESFGLDLVAETWLLELG